MDKMYKTKTNAYATGESEQIKFMKLINQSETKEYQYEKVVPKRILYECRIEGIPLTDITEIRIRKGQNVLVRKKQGFVFLSPITDEEMEDYFLKLCQYSPYAYKEELKECYLSFEGGFRIGICGQMSEGNGDNKTLRFINGMNIRFHNQWRGVSDPYLKYLSKDRTLINTIIVSVPGGGKTSFLRDFIRNISNGTKEIKAHQVSLIDERNEISGLYLGRPQLDVGRNTDVLSYEKKSLGMIRMIRSMAPEVLAFDELGEETEYEIIKRAFYSGIGIVCTIHGKDYTGLLSNHKLMELLDLGMLQRIVYLSSADNPGQVLAITDAKNHLIYKV